MLEHSLKNYVDNRVLGGMVGLLRPGRGYAAWGGVPGLGQIRGLAPPQRGFKRAKDPNAADARVPHSRAFCYSAAVEKVPGSGGVAGR